MARRKKPREPTTPTAGRPTTSDPGSVPTGTPHHEQPTSAGGHGGTSPGVGAAAAAAGAAAGVGAHGGTRAEARQAAAQATVAGPSVAESSAYRRAARAQAALIQKYALNRERDRLEQKHYEFDEQDRIKKLKVTREQIHDDLQTARERVKKTTERLFNNKRVYQANVSGKVLSTRKINRINQRQLSKAATHREEVKAQTNKLLAAKPVTPKQVTAAVKPAVKQTAPQIALGETGKHSKAFPHPEQAQASVAPWMRAALGDADNEKSYDIFIDPKTGRPDRFSNYASLGYRITQALTGDDSYAGTGDLGEIASVVGGAGLMAATGGAAASARAAAVAKGAAKIAAAERAAATPEFVASARGARTVGVADLTGEIPAGTTRAGRLTAAARARYGAEARALRRAKRGQTLTLKALNPIFPAVASTDVGRALAQGHYEALTEDTGQTLSTTGRAIWGLPAATFGPIIDVATGHSSEAVDALADYAGEYGELFSGDPEKVKSQITENLGLVPALTGVLGATAIGRAAGVKIKPYSRSVGRVEALAHAATYGKTPAIRRAAKNELDNFSAIGEPLTSRHAGRKAEAERSAVTAEMETGQAARESRTGGKRPLGIGPRQKDTEALGELNTEMLNEHVSKGDVVGFLSETPITSKTRDPIGKLREIRNSLREPSKAIDPDEIHTRAVIDAIIEHPEVLKDPKVRHFIDREVVKGQGRSVERHTERTGERQTTPDPLEEPVRFQAIARAEGVPLPHERTPAGYEGNLTPKPGQNMNKAIREEAAAMTREAKTKKRQAKIEETKARGTAKELNARRVADDRRQSTRAKNKKVRTLEKRIAAWTEKAKNAKRPETKKRYQAKVKQLRAQLRDTKATLKLAASPTRLRTVRRATEHKARAKQLRAEAEALVEQAKNNLAVINQMRHAESLDIAAARLRAKGEHTQAMLVAGEANRVRAAGLADQARIRDEFMADVRGVQEREGYGEPAFRRHTDVTNKGGTSVAAQDFTGAKAGKKERFREGVLAEEGRIDESALTLLTNSRQIRAGMAERWRQVGFVRDNFLKIKGKRFFAAAEKAKMQREGKVPAGYEWVALSEFAQGLQRVDALKAEVGLARADAIALAAKGERKLYGLVKRSALHEYRAQMDPLGKGWRGVRAASRLQTIGMLGTSTAWFALQFPATLLTMVARNPNPVAWARAITRQIHNWRNLEPWERTNLNAHFAGNPADFLAVGENVRGIRPGTVAAMDRSMQIAFGTPMGKIVHAVWDNLRHGGPLIALNRRYESFQRRLMGMLEMDRIAGTDRHGKIRVSARPREFIGSTAKLSHLVRRDLKELKGKSYAEQTRFYLDNPKRMREIEVAVDDAYGNWAALTSFEKKLASVVVFYPYVRFSMRWMFWSFPKNNPIKAAIYLNLSQHNAQELQEFLGGPPSFFSDFGKVVTHTGPGGTAETALNLSRIAPGGNAVVEAVGGAESLNLQTLLRPVQPIVGITTGALTGKDQFGEDLPEGTSRFDAFLKGAASLNPITRTLLAPKIIPPSEFSELFKVVTGRDSGLLGALVPDVLSDPAADQEAARLGRMLEAAQAAPSSSDVKAARVNGASHEEQKAMAAEYQRGKELWAMLDGYLVAYGIKTAAEIKGDDKAYEKSAKQGARLLARAAGEAVAEKPETGYGAIDLGGSGGKGYGPDTSGSAAFEHGYGSKPMSTKIQPSSNLTPGVNEATTQAALMFGIGVDSKPKSKSKPDTELAKDPIIHVPSYVPDEYKQDIANAAKYGVRPEMFAAQIRQESGFTAKIGSPAGAQGIAQIMPGTAASWGVDPNDPHAALEVAAQHMGEYLKAYNGDEAKALAAYNAGPGAVEEYGGVPPFEETQTYVKNILGAAGEGAVPEGKPVPKKTVTRYQAIKDEAKKISSAESTYVLGGGHVAGKIPGVRQTNYDCSSFVSRVLQKAGVKLPGALVSGDLATTPLLKDGPGAVTIYANDGHTFMRIGNKFYGTSRSNPGGGPGLIEGGYDESYLSQYTVRHVPGLSASVARRMGIRIPAGGTSGSVPGISMNASGTTATVTDGVQLAAPGESDRPIASDKQRKGRFSKLELLQATQEDQGLQKLLGLPVEGAAPEDATMAAMAEIAATRKRLLKR